MELGMVGLGRMGSNLVKRLTDGGHQCFVTDINADAVQNVVDETGATGAADAAALAAAMTAPRAIWVMVPAAVVGPVMDSLVEHLEPGDVVIDGGNSFHADALARAAVYAERDIHHVDIGTSGGVHGLKRGFCLMVGGAPEAVNRLAPVLDTLAPGIEAAPRTPAHAGSDHLAPGEVGWLHCGGPGSGHFVKMVHNGIEYGMMAAFAEGFSVLNEANLGAEEREADAETAPLRNPEMYRYDINVPAVAEVWRRGSVVGSWLLDLTADEMADDPELSAYAGRVSDSGAGRWTVKTAIDLGIPANVLSAAVYQRFSSRGRGDYGNRALSAMRNAFGGHREKPAK